ncbi:hypothetical protein C8R45DRAFT_931215 [Mycena sanguinolenta]|nr:hypothetical protein C8R45DRAFT_931215 [Mycena sanguinolenta]
MATKTQVKRAYCMQASFNGEWNSCLLPRNTGWNRVTFGHPFRHHFLRHRRYSNRNREGHLRFRMANVHDTDCLRVSSSSIRPRALGAPELIIGQRKLEVMGRYKCIHLEHTLCHFLGFSQPQENIRKIGQITRFEANIKSGEENFVSAQPFSEVKGANKLRRELRDARFSARLFVERPAEYMPLELFECLMDDLAASAQWPTEVLIVMKHIVQVFMQSLRLVLIRLPVIGVEEFTDPDIQGLGHRDSVIRSARAKSQV